MSSGGSHSAGLAAAIQQTHCEQREGAVSFRSVAKALPSGRQACRRRG